MQTCNTDAQLPDMKVDIGGIRLKNPVMSASGTFGYGAEFAGLMDLNCLGAIIVKGLSLLPSKGNPPPRIVETASGMLNAIGLENVGLNAFITNKLPFLRRFSTPVIVNIYGESFNEYAELAQRLDGVEGVAGLELNISCPNVTSGGIAFGVNAKIAHRLVQAVRRSTTLPLMVKLSPNVTDIVEIATSVEAAGADALSLINTLTGMAIDVQNLRPLLANVTGGLSGPAIKPIALRMVWQVAQKVQLPVVGVGGIMSAMDALEFLIAGASAVQVGTASFVNPQVAKEIIDELERYMLDNRIPRLSTIIGSLQT